MTEAYRRELTWILASCLMRRIEIASSAPSAIKA